MPAFYKFTHIPTGKVGKVTEANFLPALLEVVGGGYTEAQVAMAMVLQAEVADGGQTRSANFIIERIEEVV